MGHKKDEIRRAIEAGRNSTPAKLPGKKFQPGKTQPKVAAAATPKKPNPRSAEARDARAKSRGRLPINAFGNWFWDGKSFSGELKIQTLFDAAEPRMIKLFSHTADGQFRLMEELDIMFWEWYAKKATVEDKAQLVFAPEESNRPEPFPKEQKETT